jgi:hypothetical protein
MTDRAKMRTLRPTHLVGLRALDARPTCVELTAPTWPRVPDDGTRLPLWSLFSQSMAPPAGYRRGWVHCGDDGIDGLLVARVRCGGLVWDVRHLWADGESVARELLLGVCEEAAARGARRVFLETGPETADLAVARSAGFEHYAWATTHVCRTTRVPTLPLARSPRPRRRGDEHMLFQLYKAAVPAPVRAAEAMTIEEWVALHKDTRRWAPGLMADRQQFIWDDGEVATGWVEIASAPKSQHVDSLVHPASEALYDDLVAFTLEQATKLPLYATCREYQQPLAAALGRAGFEVVGERAVFARQLAIRIAEPRLVAARARPTLGG